MKTSYLVQIWKWCNAHPLYTVVDLCFLVYAEFPLMLEICKSFQRIHQDISARRTSVPKKANSDYTLTHCHSLVVTGHPHQKQYLLVHLSSLPQESVMETQDVKSLRTKSRNSYKFDISLLIPKRRSLE